jgi:hypothetical protein
MALSPNYNWSEPDNSSLVKDGALAMRTLGDAIDTSLWNSGYGQAGKNKIINGDFFINQRGFTSTTTSNTAVVDRFRILLAAAAGSVTTSVEQFTPGTAPVAGYEAKQYVRIITTGQAASTDRALFAYYGIEDVRTFAGQTVTLSFWAKAATGTPSIAMDFAQVFGTGGSPSTAITGIGAVKTAITTAWERYSFTVAIPSISGKTIGTDANTSSLQFGLWVSAGSSFDSRTDSLGVQNNTFDIWGVQVEYGSVATPFQTASGGSIQGELAMCQRYFQLWTGPQFSRLELGYADSITNLVVVDKLPVCLRATPTLVVSNMTANGSPITAAGVVNVTSTNNTVWLNLTTSGVGVGSVYQVYTASGTTGVVSYSAEL